MQKYFKLILTPRYLLIIAATILIIFLVLPKRNTEEISTSNSNKIHNSKIIEESLPDIKEQFVKMKKANWDVTKPLSWGYYFYDTDKNRLSKFAEVLKKNKLRVYPIKPSGDPASKQYTLYAYEFAIYTPDSFFARNKQIVDLAVTSNIEQYDGWEAGPKPRE